MVLHTVALQNALEEVEQYISTEFIEDPRFRRGVTHCGTSSFCQVTNKGLLILWTVRKRLDQEEKAKWLSLKRSVSNESSLNRGRLNSV